MVKKISIGIISVILAVILLFGGFLAFASIRDYQPEDVIRLVIENNQSKMLQVGETYTALTFNIGYAGLDKNADFFMDGGTKSRAESKATVENNLSHLMSYMKNADPDFLLVQEVDVDSTRSFYVNELDYLQKGLPEHGSTFAYNYIVDWVPVPVFHPMGKAVSGIATFSKYQATKSTRYALPGEESWPVQLFELDRCMSETRFPVGNGKELVIMHLHLSAFDEGGKIRQQQISFLKEHIEKENEKGNYILIGGDWNHILPTTDPNRFTFTEDTPFWIQTLPEDFTPAGFTWVADADTPSVRTLATSYKEGENYLAVIDGFLVSDNIEVKSVKGTHLGFEYSDHNPVMTEFVLK